jgi:putative transposase
VIGIDGTKHPLALIEGCTENATLVTDLLVDLRERALDVTRPILCVLDGAKALHDKLPERLRGPVQRRMRAAYHAPSALDAEAQLAAMAHELDRTHPGAAASPREGLGETLTVLRLEVPPGCAPPSPSRAWCRAAASTPAAPERWRDGTMALRWCEAGMVEAGKQFRRVNDHMYLPALGATLQAEAAGAVTGPCEDQEVQAA